MILNDIVYSVSVFIPEIILIITLIVAIFTDVLFKKHQIATGIVSLIGYVVACIFTFTTVYGISFMGTLVADPFSIFFKALIALASIITTLFTFNSNELLKGQNNVGEFYILLTGMTLGMFLLVSANNLLMLYIAFETMSICSYVLAGYTKEVKRSSEASLKYVIYGSLASGIMIYGISLLFGLTGTLDLAGINSIMSHYTGNNIAWIVAGLMVFAGIAYKISAVPFHFWTPDVYEGSPIATTALLSVASKAAGFAVLIRIIKAAFVDTNSSTDDVWVTFFNFDWSYLIGIVAVLTMTLGNLLAIWQKNIKRMLAYSSIAHCGYMLMGVMVMTSAGVEGVLFYFVTYLLMNFGAFYVVQIISNKINSENMDDYAGLAYKNPYVAIAMSIFLLSLTGIPPFAGFLSKFYLFIPVLESGYVGIAIIGVLNSVVSVFYYLKVVRNMYLRGGDITAIEKMSFTKPSMFMLYALVIPVVLLIFAFQPILNWIKTSAAIMLIK